MDTNYSYATDELREKDRDHLIHPFSDLAVNKAEGCTIIAEADGVHVYDSDGNRFIDGIGGLWCVNIGYGREEMAQAIADQVRRIPFYSGFVNLTNPPAAELAAKLAELAPGNLERVMFGTGGSMANDSAVRIIHHYFNRLGKSEKKHVISREHAYHGSTYLAIALTGPTYHEGWDVAKGFIHHIPEPDSYRRPDGMSMEEFCDLRVQDLEDKILEVGPEKVACFIAEPIMGAGGMIVPPPGYQKRTFEVCRKHDVLYISDEVVTGFGRLGHMFASQDVFGFTPDVLTCAKGLTSGYLPLSATILSEDIYDVISAPGAAFFHGFTYTGHPVACAAGLKNIEILEREDICGNVRRTGPMFEAALQGLRDLELVGDVRGSHFMMCIESVADRETKALLPEPVNVGKRIADACQKRGLIVRPLGHLNILSPPLIVTDAQIEEIAQTLRGAIRETMDDLVREGLWQPKS
jgi:adenosylmethionine-8-amino-7-oxononanoate aminotransferase